MPIIRTTDVTRLWESLGTFWDKLPLDDKEKIQNIWRGYLDGLEPINDILDTLNLSTALSTMPPYYSSIGEFFEIIYGATTEKYKKFVNVDTSNGYKYYLDDGRHLLGLSNVKNYYWDDIGSTRNYVNFESGVDFTIDSGGQYLEFINDPPVTKDQNHPLLNKGSLFAEEAFFLNPVLFGIYGPSVGMDISYFTKRKYRLYTTIGNNIASLRLLAKHFKYLIWGLRTFKKARPNLSVLRKALGLAFGIPFAYEDGLITTSDTSFVLDDNGHSYYFTNNMPRSVEPGNKVNQFDLLVDGFELYDWETGPNYIVEKGVNQKQRKSTLLLRIPKEYEHDLVYDPDLLTELKKSCIPPGMNLLIDYYDWTPDPWWDWDPEDPDAPPPGTGATLELYINNTFIEVPSGDEGTETNPYSDINSAITAIIGSLDNYSRVRFMIQGGPYRERIDISGYDIPVDTAIEFIGDENDPVELWGSVQKEAGDWTAYGNGIYYSNWYYNWFEGIPDYDDSQHAKWLYGWEDTEEGAKRAEILIREEGVFKSDGTPLRFKTLLSDLATQDNTFFIDQVNNRLYVKLAGNNPALGDLEITVLRSGLHATWITHLTVKNLHFRHFSTGLKIDGVKNFVGRDLQFYKNTSTGFDFNYCGYIYDPEINQRTLAMYDSETSYNGKSGGHTNMSKGFRFNNFNLASTPFSHHNNYRGSWAGTGGWAIAGLKNYRTTNYCVQNCVFTANLCAGLWFDKCAENTNIYNCTMRENSRSGIFLELNKGPIYVTNCTITENGSGEGIETGEGNAGVKINTCQDVRITGCTLDKNASWPIGFVGANHRTCVEANNTAEQTNYCYDSIITGNTIEPLYPDNTYIKHTISDLLWDIVRERMITDIPPNLIFKEKNDN